MELLLEQLLNAVLLGCVYTLVAVGFSLFFGVVNVVVFCGGDIAAFGAFSVLLFYLVFSVTGFLTSFPAWLFVLIIVICGAALGSLFGKAAYTVSIKPYEKKSELMPLLSTIALGILVRELIGLLYPQGRNPQVFPSLLPSGTIIEGSALTVSNLMIIVITVGILGALFLLINKTKLGWAMQTLSQDKETASMIGINIKRVINFTFVLGGAILGVGGFLIGSYYGIVRFDMGASYGLIGFSAAVVGGLGNIYGAIVGGMLLSFVEVFISGYIPGGTAYARIFSFLIVVIFMIFRPEGILGQKTVEKV
ncbi:MAG: branched-chain amino acid ABC transporter permease [Spirochaetales bacterium]|nr:branched-chain amino acid ABC transporter permease [Spirochaetales bacterium]